MQVPENTKCTNCDKPIKAGPYAIEGNDGEAYCSAACAVASGQADPTATNTQPSNAFIAPAADPNAGAQKTPGPSSYADMEKQNLGEQLGAHASAISGLDGRLTAAEKSIADLQAQKSAPPVATDTGSSGS